MSWWCCLSLKNFLCVCVELRKRNITSKHSLTHSDTHTHTHIHTRALNEEEETVLPERTIYRWDANSCSEFWSLLPYSDLGIESSQRMVGTVNIFVISLQKSFTYYKLGFFKHEHIIASFFTLFNFNKEICLSDPAFYSF